VILHDVFSVDEARNKAMKIERLQRRAPHFKCLMSMEEPLDGEGIQLSSTMIDQLLAQQTVKVPVPAPITTTAAAKNK